MVKILGALVLAGMAPLASGAGWTVCVHDADNLLGVPVRAALVKEFSALMGRQRVRFDSCATGSRHIHVAVSAEAPGGLPGILGMARRRAGRIEPRLHVFHGPLVRYLGNPNRAEAIGRALARVAAHEAEHFLQQEPEHCEHGLLRAALPAFELLAADRSPFRHGTHCRNGQRLGRGGSPVAEARAPR